MTYSGRQASTPEPFEPEPDAWEALRLDLLLPALALLVLVMAIEEQLRRNGPPPGETDEDREGRVRDGWRPAERWPGRGRS